MKKIIFISGIQIFPPESGGQLRSSNICHAFSSIGFEVDIYSFTGRKKDYLNNRNSGETKITSSITEYVNRNPILGVIQFLFYKACLPPVWLTWLTKIYLPRQLQNKIENSSMLILDFPFLYPLSRKIKSRVLLNTHNAEFEFYSQNKLLADYVKKIELESFRRSDEIFFCSSEDQTKFIPFFPAIISKSFILPNGVQLKRYSHDSEARATIRVKHNITQDEKVFLFTGSHFYPNIEAAKFLKKWCQLNRNFLKNKKIIIMIVGSVLDEIYESDVLKITGKVLEVSPYFSACDFALNPMEKGSGTNIKMIEFLAARIPVLTTTFGARGLKLLDKHHCFYFQKEKFAEVLEEAINTNEKTRKIMCEEAFIQNRNVIDMNHALKTLPISW